MNVEDFRMIDLPNLPQEVSIAFERVKVTDTNPDLSYLRQFHDDVAIDLRKEYRARDIARLAAFERGEWEMLGLMVKCTIHVPMGGNSFQVFTMKSAGLWGVESDSQSSYFAEVWDEEENSLREALRVMGEAFSKVGSLIVNAPEHSALDHKPAG